MAGHMQGHLPAFSRYSLSTHPLRDDSNDVKIADDTRLSLCIGSDTPCHRGLWTDVFRNCAVEAVVWQKLTVTVVPMSRA